MINFRYHIISITAVFLALGLGLALGTSFGNRALVSSLQNTQRSLDREVHSKRDENSKLRAEAAQAKERSDRFAQQAVLGPLVSGQLEGVPVLMIAPTGIDEASLTRVRTALTTSGASFAGTLRIDRRFALEGDNAAKAATILNLPVTTPRADLRRRLVNELAAALRQGATISGVTPTTAPATSTTTTTEPAGSTTTAGPSASSTSTTTAPTGETAAGQEPAVITALRDAGFLQLEPPDNGSKSDPIVLDGGYRYLFVSGPGADLPDADLLLPLVRALAESPGVPVVVASAAVGDDPEAVRTQVVGPIRDDPAVSQSVSTVDDLESFQGIAATVLALQEAGSGRHGQYGVGQGATAPLPPVPNGP